MTSDCPMLQDLAFDAISSFSMGLKLSICKGGFHTGSFSYCGKLPFQLFLRGAPKWLPCGPLPLSQFADHQRKSRQGMGRLIQAGIHPTVVRRSVEQSGLKVRQGGEEEQKWLHPYSVPALLK